MRVAFICLLVLHGLIHLLGFLSALGWHRPAQLMQPVSMPLGVLWLSGCAAWLLTGALLAASSRAWMFTGVVALCLSQGAIFSAWTDAKFGTVANLLLLLGVVYGFASEGPTSFTARCRRQVAKRLQPVPTQLVEEADLAHLPALVQRFVRRAGVVGQPRVQHVESRWRGRIRAQATDPWMPFTAEQHDFIAEPARFFLMKARRGGLPVDVYHQYLDGSARMQVRLLSLLPVVDTDGPTLDRAETVTVFNDLCLLAPSALLDPTITWETLSDRSVRALYLAGGHSIQAELHFNDNDELINFVSDDRAVASPDGKTFTQRRWSTPVGEAQAFGPWRSPTRGEGRWHGPEGPYTYLEIELSELKIDGSTAL